MTPTNSNSTPAATPEDLLTYPRVIRDRLRRAPHREQAGFPAGYDHAYEQLLDISPEDATHDELNTTHLIRQQLNPDFTVEQLRESRARAIKDAITTANMLETAGLTHQADVYRALALRLTPPAPTSKSAAVSATAQTKTKATSGKSHSPRSDEHLERSDA